MKKTLRLLILALAIIMALGVTTTTFAYNECQHGSGGHNDEALNADGVSSGGTLLRTCINLQSDSDVTNAMSTSSGNTGHVSFGYCYKAACLGYTTIERTRIRDLRVDPKFQSNWVSENANTSYKYVYNVQHALKSLGYNPGTLDGVWGTNTRNAIVAFQTRNNLGADGVVGTRTWFKLAGTGR